MRLRVSGQQTGNEYDLRSIMGESQGEAGLPHADLLSSFAEALCCWDLVRIAGVRAEILDAMGEKALVDAAATIAAFNAYPRMADATGIPLENAKEDATMEMRAELGIETLKHY